MCKRGIELETFNYEIDALTARSLSYLYVLF